MGILDKIKKPKKGEAPVAAPVEADKKPAAKKATKAPKAPAKSAETKPTAAVGTDAHRILVRPLLSEKTSAHETHGQYTFEVARNATKVDVKRAVKAVYGVTPKKVNMINLDGKQTRFGRSRGSRKNTKKAVVMLTKGESISIHEGV